MVGEAYGWANSHRSRWVGLLHAGVQLLPTYLSQGRIVESPDLRHVGLCSVDRYSLTPMTSPWLPNGCVLRSSTSGSTETIFMIMGGLVLT